MRGKYAKRLKPGANLVLLAPDLREYFPDDRAVNDALRLFVRIAKTRVRRMR